MKLAELQSEWERLMLLPEGAKLLESGTDNILGQNNNQILNLYRDLLRFTVVDLLKNLYPYTVQLLSLNIDQLRQIADELRREYPNTSPQVIYAVEAFPKYLSESTLEEITIIREKHPYLIELSQYEWAELIAMHSHIEDLKASKQPELSDHSLMPVFNNSYQIAHYNYPINQIIEQLDNNQSLESISPESKYLMLYRDIESDKMRSLALDAISAQFLYIAKQDECTGLSIEEIITVLSYQLSKSPEELTGYIAPLLAKLYDKGVLLNLIEV